MIKYITEKERTAREWFDRPAFYSTERGREAVGQANTRAVHTIKERSERPRKENRET